MGYFIKDLYVQRVPKFKWHDKLTNPPTVPETSPIIKIASLSPAIARYHEGGGGGGVMLPADDTTLTPIPTPITPIVTPVGRLELGDLHLVRENLELTLKAVEAQIEQMQPSAEDLEYFRSAIKGG